MGEGDGDWWGDCPLQKSAGQTCKTSFAGKHCLLKAPKMLGTLQLFGSHWTIKISFSYCWHASVVVQIWKDYRWPSLSSRGSPALAAGLSELNIHSFRDKRRCGHLSPAVWLEKLLRSHVRLPQGLDKGAAGTVGQQLWYLHQSWLHFAWAAPWTRFPLRGKKDAETRLVSLATLRSCDWPFWLCLCFLTSSSLGPTLLHPLSYIVLSS